MRVWVYCGPAILALSPVRNIRLPPLYAEGNRLKFYEALAATIEGGREITGSNPVAATSQFPWISGQDFLWLPESKHKPWPEQKAAS